LLSIKVLCFQLLLNFMLLIIGGQIELKLSFQQHKYQQQIQLL